MTAYFSKLLEATDRPAIELVVTPVTPYFICDHFIATELFPSSPDFIRADLKPTANNLLCTEDYASIRDLDIVQVQADYLDFFCQFALPVIAKRGIRIVVLTSKSHLPEIKPDWPRRRVADFATAKNFLRQKRENVRQILRVPDGRKHCSRSLFRAASRLIQELPRLHSRRARVLLEHPNVALWISQNPIYVDNPKYLAFPFGIDHLSVDRYIQFARGNRVLTKTCRVANLHTSVHSHLPANHVRRTHPIFGADSGPNLGYEAFLGKVAAAEFVMSPPGDREDCYRHYECIGLEAIPVSTISREYTQIFGDDMCFMTADEMVNMVHSDALGYRYHTPNRDILSVEYWKDKIFERLAHVIRR